VNDLDFFIWFWRAGIAVFIAVNLAWGINDLQRGSARMSWYGSRVERSEEPFEFWLTVLGKFVALPIGGMMLWFSLKFGF
jgi:hypothetical protein